MLALFARARRLASHRCCSQMAQQTKVPGKKKKESAWVEPAIDFPFVNTPYVDSHNHLLSTFSALKKQDPSKDYSIADFDHYVNEQGLNRFASFGSSINVNCDPASFQSGLQIQRTIPNFYGAFGIHPHNAVEYNDQVEVEIAAALQDPKSVAVGEMGLDYYYMNSTREIQIACFRRQLKWGIEVMKKPIIIHTRDAEDDTKAILEEIVPIDWNVHIHCFTGSPEFARWATARFPNLFIGFTGCITFPSASNLRDLIQELPLERLLLETDSPFMAPVPYRGRVSHSGMIPLVARQIAQIKQVDVKTVIECTTNNACRMYGIQVPPALRA